VLRLNHHKANLTARTITGDNGLEFAELSTLRKIPIQKFTFHIRILLTNVEQMNAIMVWLENSYQKVLLYLNLALMVLLLLKIDVINFQGRFLATKCQKNTLKSSWTLCIHVNKFSLTRKLVQFDFTIKHLYF